MSPAASITPGKRPFLPGHARSRTDFLPAAGAGQTSDQPVSAGAPEIAVPMLSDLSVRTPRIVRGLAVVVSYAVCAAVWGTTWFAIRASIGPGGYPTFASAAIRFSLAGALLGLAWLAGLARPGPKSRRAALALGAAGVLNGAQYSLIYAAEERISGGLAAVVFGTFPLWTALIAMVTGTERVSAARVAGSLVSLGGIALVFGDRLDVSAGQAGAVGLVLLGVIVSAASSVLVKREAADVNPLATAFIYVAVTAVVTWTAGATAGELAIPWPPPATPTLAVVYLAVFGSVIAFASYFFLLRRVTLMTITTLVFIQPVIALSVDAIWEQQIRLTARSYAGAGITLAGVMISLIAAARQATLRK